MRGGDSHPGLGRPKGSGWRGTRNLLWSLRHANPVRAGFLLALTRGGASCPPDTFRTRMIRLGEVRIKVPRTPPALPPGSTAKSKSWLQCGVRARSGRLTGTHKGAWASSRRMNSWQPGREGMRKAGGTPKGPSHPVPSDHRRTRVPVSMGCPPSPRGLCVTVAAGEAGPGKGLLEGQAPSRKA